MQTTVAPLFFASPMPSSPKWSKCPCVAATTSSLPKSNPFGNFGLFPMKGSIATRAPSGDSIRNAAWPSQVTFPPNVFHECLPCDPRNERRDELLEPGAVLVVETVGLGRVDVEDADQRPVGHDRHDDLRP